MPAIPRSEDVKAVEVVTSGITAAAVNVEVTSSNIDVSDATALAVSVNLTRGGALTALTIDLDESPDGGSNWFAVQFPNGAGPGVDLDPYQLTRTTSVSGRFTATIGGGNNAVDLRPLRLVRLRFNGTAANASDTITVELAKSRGD